MSSNLAINNLKNRVFKGKSLYRWEDSPGLEHHCGTCATPLHNARAKTSCLGIHVEPCYRFHQQLHFVGKSHECFGCNKSDEMHHNRHKEILKLIRRIAELDEPTSLSDGFHTTSNTKHRRSSGTTSSVTDTSSETTIEDGKHLTRSERKKAKKTGVNTCKRKNIEVFPREDIDFVSEAIHLTIHESKGAWQGTYDYRKTAQIPERLNDKEATEMAGPLERLSDSPVTHVDDFMTPKSVQEMTPRQRKNAKRISTPVKHSGYGGGSRRYLCRRESASELYDGIDPEIFFRLGVAIVDPPKNSVARKDLVTKLLAAVKDDLQIVAQENMEAEMREAGFRRWAGKTAWNNIKDVRQTLDWATGQKIDPLTHRPTSDMNAPPFLDENGIENVRPVSDFDEHAVKLPSIGASTGLEDSDNVSNPEFTSIHLSHLPKITEESFDEDVQVPGFYQERKMQDGSWRFTIQFNEPSSGINGAKKLR